MRRVAGILLLAIVVSGCGKQEGGYAVAPSEKGPGKAPEGKPAVPAPETKSEFVPSRFKMFYSPLVRADTFLLDTGSGAVSQMYSDPTTGIGFQSLTVAGMLKPVKPEAGRFAIFYSPLVRADTFLVDTEVGQVWQMTQAADKQIIFAPIKQPFAPVPGIYDDITQDKK